MVTLVEGLVTVAMRYTVIHGSDVDLRSSVREVGDYAAVLVRKAKQRPGVATRVKVTAAERNHVCLDIFC